MSGDTYRTIAAPATGSYSEKRSRFIAYAFPVATEEEAGACLAKVRKRHADARHHCFAYALGPGREIWRTNDGGEPSGTAGRPIYGQMLSKDITDVIIVVARYFGGVKLGAGGLLNAYRTAARAAIDNATVIERAVTRKYEVSFGYERMNAVMQTLKGYDVKILRQESGMRCTVRFSVRLRTAGAVVQTLGRMPQTEVRQLPV